MTTLTVYDRNKVDPIILSRRLADDLHAPVNVQCDEDRGDARFTSSASIERVELAAEFWLPLGGWDVR
ncbi:MAG: hypothetical protein M0Z51_11105 [Propionibacterium sp.]|nr:hypothetical protein [Propionibacterium sp.]